jgi:hypothetical protein
MWWFSKKERREIWDEPIEEPPGDIDAAQRIREICRSASDSAERVGASGAQSVKKKKPESERYERAAKAAMAIAIKMSDDLMRDASDHPGFRKHSQGTTFETLLASARPMQS